MAVYRPGERLFLTADKTALVPAGHPEANEQFCTETEDISIDQAIAYGLVTIKENPKPRNGKWVMKDIPESVELSEGVLMELNQEVREELEHGGQ